MKRSFLLGTGISHSISTAVHNAGAAHLGLEWRYELYEVERADLPQALARIRREDCTGANVTMPLKGDAARAADSRSDSVERCGAANLLLNTAAGLAAGNTDIEGMAALLERRRDRIAAGAAILIGAGAAAAATIEALARVRPASITVLARREEAAVELAERAAERLGVEASGGRLDQGAAIPSTTTLLVNATALGMNESDPSPLAAADLGQGTLVYDYVYSRTGPTRLQREAVAAGAEICDGGAHLLAQALPTFRALAGVEPPKPVLRAAVTDALGGPFLEWS